MTKTNKDEAPGFRNYDKWIEGYHPLLKWILNELKCIRTNKPTTTEEKWSEISPRLINSLLKGASTLQYVGERDFYYKDNKLEILIRYKKDYKDIPIENRPWELLREVINLLELEEEQLIRIAASY